MTSLTLVRSLALLASAIVVQSARRAARTVAAYLLVAGLLTASLAFLTLAGYRAIGQSLGDVSAAAIVGCAYLLAALLVLLVILLKRR